jgi:branched-chain amino acid transport system substrate-binding protein
VLFKIRLNASLCVAIVLLALLGCASGKGNPYLKRDRSAAGSVNTDRSEFSYSNEAPRHRLPWILWHDGQDFEGQILQVTDIQQGDELVATGKFPEALVRFQSIKPEGLSARERRALMFRIGAMQLARNNSSAALSTLSQYFASIGLRVEDVEPAPSLFLGYAYGQAGNLDQSMAWFARAHTIAQDDRRVREKAKSALRETLASIAPDRFEQVVVRWDKEPIIDEMVSQERARRSRSGYRYAQRNLFRADAYYTPHQQQTFHAQSSASGELAVILPLSGKYAALGEQLKRGLQLALKDKTAQGVTGEFYDSTGTTEGAVSELRRALSGQRPPSFVVGPLLSDPAEEVARELRQIGIPNLSFSKRNNFETGQGIFRLGVTAQSQVRQLVEKSHFELGIKSYAIIAPSDYVGAEFADSFRSELAQHGINLLFEGTYQPASSVSIQRLAEQVENYPVEAVFFPGDIDDAALFFSTMPAEFRRKVRPLGTAAWDNPVKLRNSQKALEGSLFVSAFNRQSGRSLVKNFVEAFQATFQTPPDFLAAQGFDAGTLLLAAIKQSSQQGYSVGQALIDIGEYEGLTGLLKISLGGEVERRYATLIFEKGNFRELPLRTVVEVSATGEPQKLPSLE